MATKTLLCLVVFTIAIFTAAAQQPNAAQSTPASTRLTTSTDQATSTSTYTYKVFQAPNKNFGYDILCNGKIVYHEFASTGRPENSSQQTNRTPSTAGNNSSVNRENLSLSKQEHAEKAALLAIEKIKRKETPALTQDELRKIVSQ